MRIAACAIALTGLMGLAACASNNDDATYAEVGTSVNTAAPAPAPMAEPAPAPPPPPAYTGSASDTGATTRAGERG